MVSNSRPRLLAKGRTGVCAALLGGLWPAGLMLAGLMVASTAAVGQDRKVDSELFERLIAATEAQIRKLNTAILLCQRYTCRETTDGEFIFEAKIGGFWFDADGDVVDPDKLTFKAPVSANAARTTKSKAGTAQADPTSIVQDIQSELKRIGCYTGEIDGAWDTDISAAVLAFNGATNNGLSPTKPSKRMLDVLRRQRSDTCG